MEQYCERTFVGPMLAALEALRIHDVHTDHIASHIGQMLGLVSRLKFATNQKSSFFYSMNEVKYSYSLH